MTNPHQIVKTNDGSDTLISSIYGDKYHSKHGSFQESIHVFIEAGLKQKIQENQPIHILEMGFGTGLNAWLTCLTCSELNVNVHYVGVEKHPIDLGIIDKLNYDKITQDPESNYTKIHQCSWNEGHSISNNFHITKLDIDIFELQDTDRFDVVYFDAFAPDTQPELWSIELFERLYQSMKQEGCLVTYCAKGQVKRNLRAANFTVESIPGPIGKREMTRAWKK